MKNYGFVIFTLTQIYHANQREAWEKAPLALFHPRQWVDCKDQSWEILGGITPTFQHQVNYLTAWISLQQMGHRMGREFSS
jgi:hypothetical protein